MPPAPSTTVDLPAHQFRASDFVKHTRSEQTSTRSDDDDDENYSHDNPTVPEDHDEDDFDLKHPDAFFEFHYQLLDFLGRSRDRKCQIFSCRHKKTGDLRAVKLWRKSRTITRQRVSRLSLGSGYDGFGLGELEESIPLHERRSFQANSTTGKSRRRSTAIYQVRPSTTSTFSEESPLPGYYHRESIDESLADIDMSLLDVDFDNDNDNNTAEDPSGKEISKSNNNKIPSIAEDSAHSDFQEEDLLLGSNIPSNSHKNQELHEFQILQHVHEHPNIVSLYELLEGPTHYYMIMDLVGYHSAKQQQSPKSKNESATAITLQSHLQQQHGERYPEDKAAILTYILLRTIVYMQTTSQVLHCDLNLSNILLDASKPDRLGLLQLIDFGEAVALNDMDADWYQPRGAHLSCVAPEVMAHDQTLDATSDLWSLGVIAYRVLSGTFPFGTANTHDTSVLLQSMRDKLSSDSDKELLFSGFVWNDMSDTAKDFLSQLLQLRPEQRPTPHQALTHPWMEQIRQRVLEDRKLCGKDTKLLQKGQQVWTGLKQAAKGGGARKQQQVLQQASLQLIATQLVLKEEKQHIDQIFLFMNVNADGKLTKDEVRRGYAELFQKPLKESDLTALFDRVDLDQTGTIEYHEFVIAAMNEKELLHTDKLNQAFDAFDLDNTGYISAANLQPWLQSYLTAHTSDEKEQVEILQSIIAQVDQDGDGRISKDEFMSMMLESATASNDNNSSTPSRGHPKIRRKRTNNTRASFHSSNIFASTTEMPTFNRVTSMDDSSAGMVFRPANLIGNSGKRGLALTEHYEIGAFIQKGSFGAVYFCTHKISGAVRAVKFVKKDRDPKENELIRREFVSLAHRF